MSIKLKSIGKSFSDVYHDLEAKKIYSEYKRKHNDPFNNSLVGKQGNDDKENSWIFSLFYEFNDILEESDLKMIYEITTNVDGFTDSMLSIYMLRILELVSKDGLKLSSGLIQEIKSKEAEIVVLTDTAQHHQQSRHEITKTSKYTEAYEEIFRLKEKSDLSITKIILKVFNKYHRKDPRRFNNHYNFEKAFFRFKANRDKK
jgi:hypothetical protein